MYLISNYLDDKSLQNKFRQLPKEKTTLLRDSSFLLKIYKIIWLLL